METLETSKWGDWEVKLVDKKENCKSNSKLKEEWRKSFKHKKSENR